MNKNRPFREVISRTIYAASVLCILIFTPLASAGNLKNIPDKEEYLSKVCEELRKKVGYSRPINIVFHGHSVPSGYFITPHVDTFNAYPHLFHKQLKAKYPYAVVNIIKTSRGGESSISGATRFVNDVLPHRPDVVFIDYSLNDAHLDIKKVRAAWESMIQEALKRKVKLILMTPTGSVGNDLNDPKNLLVIHANQVKELAKIYGVGLVDSFAPYQKYYKKNGNINNLLSNRINHPNRKGHNLVAKEIMKWFEVDKPDDK